MTQTLPTANPFISTAPLQKRLDRLWLSLNRAIRHERSAILLAVYFSEFIRKDAETYLAEKLNNIGKKVVRVQISKTLNDIPIWLRDHPDRDNSVFFISGLRWDGENGRKAYRSLNIRREYFTDYNIKAIFWLTDKEAAELPLFATDFWVFRHQAVDFIDKADKSHIEKYAYDLIWRRLDNRTLNQNIESEIAFREQLITEIPDQSEWASTVARLFYTLAPLYSAQHRNAKAIEVLLQALNYSQRLGDATLQSKIFTSLGIIYSYLGRHKRALTAYQRAIQLEPNSANLLNSLGDVYYTLGRYEEAIDTYKLAIRVDSNYVAPLKGLGLTYHTLGQTEEAIAIYLQAIQLEPNSAYLYYILGNVYRDMNHNEEAISSFEQAINLDPNYLAPLYSLGYIYRDTGRYEEAIAIFQKATLLDPTYISLYDENFNNNVEQYDKAIIDYE